MTAPKLPRPLACHVAGSDKSDKATKNLWFFKDVRGLAYVSIRVRGTSDENDIHDEDGLQNQNSLMIIENGPPHHEI